MSDFTRWERGNAGAAVIFVHGLFGHPTKTWGRFPELVLQDGRLSHCDVVTWGYHSPAINLWDRLRFFGRRTPSVEAVASSLLTFLQNESALPPTHQLVLVGHSMGGLVILRALLAAAAGTPEEQAVLERIRSVVLYASPVQGVDPSAILEVHRQAKQLAATSDLIESTCRDWQAKFHSSAKPEDEKRYLPVTAIVGREDNAVPEKSARAFWSDVEVAHGSHTEVCKPKDLRDTRYFLLRRQIEKHVLGTLHRGAPAILAAHDRLLRSAREELFCIGSRSRDADYM